MSSRYTVPPLLLSVRREHLPQRPHQHCPLPTLWQSVRAHRYNFSAVCSGVKCLPTRFVLQVCAASPALLSSFAPC